MTELDLPELAWDVSGTLIARPNRFLAQVQLDDRTEVLAHVADPGRLTDLLYPGNRLRLKDMGRRPARKTTHSLVLAALDDAWILVNTTYHRRIAEALLRWDDGPFGHLTAIRPEVRVGHSRLDFMVARGGRDLAIEVKGCALAKGGVGRFPDAPTERGRKHLATLTALVEEGHPAALLVLVLRPDAQAFGPHAEIDPDFAKAFWQAIEAGVEVVPYQVLIHEERFTAPGPLPLVSDRH